ADPGACSRTVYPTPSKSYRCSNVRRRPRAPSPVCWRGLAGGTVEEMRVRGWLRDPAWLGTVLVCALALLSIGIMVATRLLIPAEDAIIPTEAWPWTAEGVGVRPLTAGSVFHVDDVVLAIDGRPLADWAADALAPP